MCFPDWITPEVERRLRERARSNAWTDFHGYIHRYAYEEALRQRTKMVKPKINWQQEGF